MSVVALYIDPRGPYPALLGPERCWDEARDARLYAGPDPIIAHPPCGPWSALRHLYQGAEHNCAVRAVEQVRAFGGVLEHPAGSLLWAAGLGLPRPGSGDDLGYTIEVEQVEWGHPARKRTWLYLVGVPSILDGRSTELLPAPPFPGRQPTHWASGSRGKSSRQGKPVPPGIKVCSVRQRRRTPVPFAEFLIELARRARKEAT